MKWFLYRLAFLYLKFYAFFCYYRKKERRKEIEEILHFCNEDWDRERIKEIAMGIFERRGLKKLNRRMIPLFDKHFIECFARVEGLDHLDQALKEGRGVVLMTGHFGNPHLSINALRMMGYDVKVLKGGRLRRAKASRFKYYETWENTVFLHDLSLAHADKKRRILEILRSGGILYQMVDAAEGRKKEFVSFLGKEMGFPTGLIHLAHQAKAAVIPFIHLYQKGQILLIFKDPIDDHWKDGEGAYKRILEECARILESYILTYPEEYIGTYGPTVLNAYYKSQKKSLP